MKERNIEPSPLNPEDLVTNDAAAYERWKKWEADQTKRDPLDIIQEEARQENKFRDDKKINTLAAYRKYQRDQADKAKRAEWTSLAEAKGDNSEQVEVSEMENVDSSKVDLLKNEESELEGNEEDPYLRNFIEGLENMDWFKVDLPKNEELELEGNEEIPQYLRGIIDGIEYRTGSRPAGASYKIYDKFKEKGRPGIIWTVAGYWDGRVILRKGKTNQCKVVYEHLLDEFFEKF